MEGRVLFVIVVLASRAIDGNDDLVAALRRFEAVPTVAPWNELPQMITVLMPACRRSVERRAQEFVGPPWRYHSPARGLIAGHHVVGRRLAVVADQAYQTTMLCARAHRGAA